MFDHYLTVWPKRRYELTTKRREKIRLRLKEFGEAEVLRALSNSRFDDWPERVNHADIETLLKSQEACERWLNMTTTGATSRADDDGGYMGYDDSEEALRG